MFLQDSSLNLVSPLAKLYLDGYTVEDFNFLNCGSLDFNVSQDATRFEAWKSCLSVLGIPFMDVVRVLAAVLLLGNIRFDDILTENNHEAKCSKREIPAVASLLGVSSAILCRGLTTVTTSNAKGQFVRSTRSAQSVSEI